jgi:UDP-galactopyranose mutase
MSKIYVVGSGFFGATFANLAANNGYEVVVIEKRNHIGGNAYSEIDKETGIEYHKHGTHIFHTSNKKVWEYVNQFSEFNDFKLYSCTNYRGWILPLPINLHTMSGIYSKPLSPEEARILIEANSKEIDDSEDNLESKSISLVGRQIYDALIKDYTTKQWETDPKLLPSETINRIPVRYNYNSRFFNDKYEGVPIDGYAKVFERMLDHPNIEVRLDTDFFNIRESINKNNKIVYSGPIDQYFDYKHGKLGWRTSYFKSEVHQVNYYQGTGLMYFADKDISYTRIHEFKHFHPERDYTKDKTLIMKEYSRFTQEGDEPCYPINSKEDKNRVKLYKQDAKLETNLIFGGRLGSYKYLDMHMAVGSAISKFDSFTKGN